MSDPHLEAARTLIAALPDQEPSPEARLMMAQAHALISCASSLTRLAQLNLSGLTPHHFEGRTDRACGVCGGPWDAPWHIEGEGV